MVAQSSAVGKAEKVVCPLNNCAVSLNIWICKKFTESKKSSFGSLWLHCHINHVCPSWRTAFFQCTFLGPFSAWSLKWTFRVCPSESHRRQCSPLRQRTPSSSEMQRCFRAVCKKAHWPSSLRRLGGSSISAIAPLTCTCKVAHDCIRKIVLALTIKNSFSCASSTSYSLDDIWDLDLHRFLQSKSIQISYIKLLAPRASISSSESSSSSGPPLTLAASAPSMRIGALVTVCSHAETVLVCSCFLPFS